MALGKIINLATTTIKAGWEAYNTLIDDLLSTETGKGASQIGLEDPSNKFTATNLESCALELFEGYEDVRALSDTFEENPATTTGLTWGYKAGIFRVDNEITTISAGTISVTDDAINYIEIDTEGTMKRNTSGFVMGRVPIRQVTCSGGIQTESLDKRAWFTTEYDKGNKYYPNYNEADQGATGNGKSTKAYIDSIASDSATLVFRHNSGSATTTYTFSTDETIPSNINIIIEKGAILSIANTKTLTINGPFDAGLYQVFSGAGTATVSIASTDGMCPEWWDAVGDASTNSHTALNKMFTSIAEFSTVKLSGVYSIDTKLLLSKSVNIFGQGVSTGFYLTMGTAEDGIQYGDTETLAIGGSMFHSTWENFGIYGGSNACRNALILKGLIECKFRNIRIYAGTAATGYGVWAMQMQSCHEVNFIMDQFTQELPFTVAGATNGFKGTASDDTGTTIIDCNLKLNTEGKAIAIYLWGLQVSSIEGLSEGNSVNSLYLKGSHYNHIHNFYVEAGSDDPVMLFENGTYNYIGPNIFWGGGTATTISLINESSTIIDGVTVNIIKIDSNCKNCRLGLTTTFGQTGSRLIDNGKNTMQLMPNLGAFQNSGAIGTYSDFNSFLINGSFERWNNANALATGSSFSSSATLTRETTIIKHGKSSVMVDTAGGVGSYIALNMPAGMLASLPYGKVTITGWVYIPTSGGNDVRIAVYMDGGAAVLAAPDPVTARDGWVKLSFSRDINYDQAYTSMQIRFYTDAASKFYLDGFSAVLGVSGGATFFTPNATEFPVYTIAEVWDPGSIASAGYEAKNFTCLGAALGMVATAGASVDVTDLMVSATVTAADTVTVILYNPTGGALDLASSTWNIQAKQLF